MLINRDDMDLYAHFHTLAHLISVAFGRRWLQVHLERHEHSPDLW